MPPKRKHADVVDGDRDAHKPSKRKYQPPGKQQKFLAQKGKPRSRPHSSQADPDTTTTSKLRSRIRDLRRLLEHVDNKPRHKMPANIRIERERELETCQHELEEKTAAAQEAEKRRNMISKYHHIRFFDRQKATRILKKLRRQLSTQIESSETSHDKSKIADLQQNIHNTEVAVNYAIYYPLTKPYASLYPRTKQEDSKSRKPLDGQEEDDLSGDADVTRGKGDPEMWMAVERAMEEGTLDELRNSESSLPVQQMKGNIRKQAEMAKAQKKAQKEQRDKKKTKERRAEEEDSDGGFFE